MHALILAAGKGTRMRSEKPKVLHEILGEPILAHVLRRLHGLGVRKPCVVIGSGSAQVRSFLKSFQAKTGIKASTVLQSQQKGTGHAVLVAKNAIGSGPGDVLIWPGDMPLVKTETLQQFSQYHRRAKAKLSVLSALMVEPKGYGRILRAGGRFYAIREELDASPAERRIQEVNTGIYLYDKKTLWGALKKVQPQNAKKEYYLTDTIEILSSQSETLEAFPLATSDEGLGINSRAQLAMATQAVNKRQILKHQEAGVTVVDAEQTYIAPGVKIGSDTVIHPWTYIESGVQIGRGCEIGPFAKIRKGTKVGDGAVIGSFVEVSRSKVGKKVLAKHLAYLGDAVVGDGTNIGAGTITANFDGKKKHQTRIGKKVLVGSDTVFIAPVQVGDGARTGAGSVVTRKTRVKKGQVVVGNPARAMKRKKK